MKFTVVSGEGHRRKIDSPGLSFNCSLSELELFSWSSRACGKWTLRCSVMWRRISFYIGKREAIKQEISFRQPQPQHSQAFVGNMLPEMHKHESEHACPVFSFLFLFFSPRSDHPIGRSAVYSPGQTHQLFWEVMTYGILLIGRKANMLLYWYD